MRARWLVASLLGVSLALTIAACGSDDDSDDSTEAATTTTSTEETAEGDPLVGEWIATNECDALVAALEDAGLEQFAAKMALGMTGERGKADPSDPCGGVQPAEHSHSFSAEGDFNSYDETGQEADFGSYEVTEDGTFTLSRPPFESEIRYEVNGDTATFEVIVPECEDKQCQTEAALAIATFFPRTYERVE